MKLACSIIAVTVVCVELAYCRYKVINGDLVKDWKKNEFKHVVYLFEGIKCTGSWVGGVKILTAAHCFCDAKPSTKVQFQRVNTEAKKTETIDIMSNVVHPDYGPCSKVVKGNPKYGVDIAVGTIKSPPTVKEVAMVPLDFDAQPAVGEAVTIMGYGLDEKSESGNLKMGVVDMIKCPEYVTNNELCAEKSSKHKNQIFAPGDSGGPLMWKNKGKYVCVGVNAMDFSSQGLMAFASTKSNKAFITSNI